MEHIPEPPPRNPSQPKTEPPPHASDDPSPFKLDRRKPLRLYCARFITPDEREQLNQAKSLGFSDRQIAHLTGRTEDEIRAGAKKK